MKTFIIMLLAGGFSIALQAQSIIGKWQLVKESNCIDSSMASSSEDEQILVTDMKSMSSNSPQIIEFKEKHIGEESMRVLGQKKGLNRRNFYYKLDGQRLLILDKKSQTLTDIFIVEKFTSDSLIVANSARPCETRVFVKID